MRLRPDISGRAVAEWEQGKPAKRDQQQAAKRELLRWAYAAFTTGIKHIDGEHSCQARHTNGSQ